MFIGFAGLMTMFLCCCYFAFQMSAVDDLRQHSKSQN